jgi:zona occludens toxin (predicted ATPase)
VGRGIHILHLGNFIIPAGNATVPTKMKLTFEGKNLHREGKFPLFIFLFAAMIGFVQGDFSGIYS